MLGGERTSPPTADKAQSLAEPALPCTSQHQVWTFMRTTMPYDFLKDASSIPELPMDQGVLLHLVQPDTDTHASQLSSQAAAHPLLPTALVHITEP